MFSSSAFLTADSELRWRPNLLVARESGLLNYISLVI